MQPCLSTPPLVRSRPEGAAQPADARSADDAGPPCWRSDDLLHGGREVHIAHAGSVYRLRLTALGKLILTK
ncbi:hemin uptake protein HemP [Aquabacterium sp. J223]|uniref:hemin uptake protein HemP n=1 Tax=Aquabacterium sp. J223 TaxID=2898431 RepID=UPI0021AD69F7|nr:hemin uptake protein HemP [Aquabacterium sp. J223]UUX97010.1 hemin uptake protein HemP [Aquabacterium sp. J223]